MHVVKQIPSYIRHEWGTAGIGVSSFRWTPALGYARTGAEFAEACGILVFEGGWFGPGYR